MAYTKKDFGRELLNKLAYTSDVYETARWTCTRFLDTRDFGSGVQEAMMEMIVIEEGPEFERSTSELEEFAKSLSRQAD